VTEGIVRTHPRGMTTGCGTAMTPFSEMTLRLSPLDTMSGSAQRPPAGASEVVDQVAGLAKHQLAQRCADDFPNLGIGVNSQLHRDADDRSFGCSRPFILARQQRA
jgi:hypothetical protein